MNIERIQHNGKRYYKVEGQGAFPSVTTVLKNTKDQSGLDRWRDKIGHEAAEKITKDAGGRGTMMHKLLEVYLNHLHIKDEDERLEITFDLTKQDEEIVPLEEHMKKQGMKLFYQVYNSPDYLESIEEVLFQEEFLWTKIGGGYAGTVDNASYLIDGLFVVIDFKTSLKWKAEKWIDDYKMQTAAYAIAIWDKHGIKPDGAEIWIANELGGVQKFILTFNDLKKYYKMFLARLKTFYQMFPPLEIYN